MQRQLDPPGPDAGDPHACSPPVRSRPLAILYLSAPARAWAIREDETMRVDLAGRVSGADDRVHAGRRAGPRQHPAPCARLPGRGLQRPDHAGHAGREQLAGAGREGSGAARGGRGRRGPGAGDRRRRRVHDRARHRPGAPRGAGRLRRADGAALHGLRAGRARGRAPFPHAGGRHRPADHDLQQPAGLQGRPQARGLPGPGRVRQHRGDQGILARQPAHDRQLERAGRPLPDVLRRRRPDLRERAVRRGRAGSRAWSTASRPRACGCSS